MRNSFYVEEQPSRSILSVVVLDELPMSEVAHQKMSELGEVSDILLIIPKNKREGIVARKIGSLYQACCWVEAECELPETLMESLEYDKEIFGNHRLILITQVSDMTEFSGVEIQKIAASSITKPIYQTRRLSSQEFFEIYRDGRKEPSMFNRFFRIPQPSPEMSNLYTTHESISKEILLRPVVVSRMIDFWKSEREDGFTGEGYVCSFVQPEIKHFVASLLKRLKQGELMVKKDEL